MRIVLSLALLALGIGLCALDGVTSGVVRARSINLYRQQLGAIPYQQRYSRAEYTAAAWLTWTNKVSLPAKEVYTVTDLKEGLFGLGTHQDSCDRPTLEGLIADASGCRPKAGSGTTVTGVLTMLLATFLLGGVIFPQSERKRT